MKGLLGDEILYHFFFPRMSRKNIRTLVNVKAKAKMETPQQERSTPPGKDLVPNTDRKEGGSRYSFEGVKIIAPLDIETKDSQA